MALNFPSSPAPDEVYQNWKWDGGKWVDNSGAVISLGPTAPASPQNGQFWLDTTTGNLFVYFYEGTSGGWVDTLNGGSWP